MLIIDEYGDIYNSVDESKLNVTRIKAIKFSSGNDSYEMEIEQEDNWYDQHRTILDCIGDEILSSDLETFTISFKVEDEKVDESYYRNYFDLKENESI